MNPQQYIKAFRQEKGWSQQEMADALGTTQQTVSNWLNGHYVPPMILTLLQLMAERDNMEIQTVIIEQ